MNFYKLKLKNQLFANKIYALCKYYNLFSRDSEQPPISLFTTTKYDDIQPSNVNNVISSLSSLSSLSSYKINNEWSIVFNLYIDENMKTSYKLTQDALDALDCIVDKRKNNLLYILMRFIPYPSKKSKYIEQIEYYKELYKAFYNSFFNNTNAKYIEVVRYKNIYGIIPILGLILQHGKYIDKELVIHLLNGCGWDNWTILDVNNDCAKYTWEKQFNREPISKLI